MKKVALTLSMFVLTAATMAAQTKEVETKSKVAVKGGDDVLVTGCVEPSATGFILTHVADKSGALHSYMLVSDDADLSKHVGHRVQISGKAADRGDATVKTETKTKTKVENGEDKESKSKSEVKGDLARVPFLGVKSVKMIAASCP
jgi:hypothetical protein